ncbi:MAG: modA [Frankiales bacterium]|nr:modA [Frankiales bacterium]
MERLVLVLVLILGGLSACGGSDASAGRSATPSDPAATALTVFAAASLTESFTALGKEFEADHPGAKVTFSFAGSQALVAQIQQGAPADVLATADTASIEAVKAETAPAQVFARNQLAIVTERGNPLGITTLADLAKPGRKVVLAGPSVPVGKASVKALTDAGITVAPVSQETDVKAVLAKVQLGEADAGLVYVTDLQAAGDAVGGTPLPGLTNSCPVAALTRARHGTAAGSFVAFVLSPGGQAVLTSYGFAPKP